MFFRSHLKAPETDYYSSELYEREIVFVVDVVSGFNTAEVLNPGEEALYFPSSLGAVKSMRNIFHHQAIIKTAIEHSIICFGAIKKPRERERTLSLLCMVKLEILRRGLPGY
jgi:hypothetical protein